MARYGSIAFKIQEEILKGIRSGEYPVGYPIPSAPQLAEMHHCSQTGAAYAVRELVKLGYLKAIASKGTLVQKVPSDSDMKITMIPVLEITLARITRMHRETGEALVSLSELLADLRAS